jgi:heptosyltransferase I
MISLDPFPPRSLCILRLSAIGDVIHVVPVVRTIQDHWPETSLTWVVGKQEFGLVGDIPDVSFVCFDKSRGWGAYRALEEDLAGRTFDILLDLQPSLRASVASWHIRAPVKLGFDRARAKDFQWLFTTHRIEPAARQHVMESFFGFLEALGIQNRTLRWDIPIPEEALRFVERELPRDRPVMVINPCSNARRRNWRNWHAEGYAAVADYAASTYGLQVVLTGGPAPLDREVGDQIGNRCRCAPLDLIGRTSLKQLLAVLDRATVLVAPDTGPAHMATSVGTPVIGLYATTNPMRARPYLSGDWVVNRYPEALEAEYGLTVERAPWGKRVRNPRAMERVTVADVKEKLDQLMVAV